MIRDYLAKIAQSALESLITSSALPAGEYSQPSWLNTKQADHGHFTCNWSMIEAKKLGRNPVELGNLLADQLRNQKDIFEEVSIAGPGFINVRLATAFLTGFLPQFGADLAHQSQTRNSKKINIEFVSVNPNGPITIGSGRGAAYGSALASVLEAVGHQVHREYYINDGVNSEQMRLFAESVKALALGEPLPENGYRGDYVQDVAETLASQNPSVFKEWDVARWQQESQSVMLQRQREALNAFGVEFDTWFSEQSLHDAGTVEKEVSALEAAGVADHRPFRTQLKLGKGGAITEVIKEDQAQPEDGSNAKETLWLRSTKFADDQDRVLRRRDGRLTYISSDIAYHWDKFSRPTNADQLITVLGPDHHGYIGRLQAVVAAALISKGLIKTVSKGPELTESEQALYVDIADRDQCQEALRIAREKLTVQIFQLVRFLKDGKPAPMRKRDGNIYALIDLLKEIGSAGGASEPDMVRGRDVARFFYLMRSHDTTFDFDLNLAEKQSDENPVFYVQYAHARICSVIQKASDQGLQLSHSHLSLLVEPQEHALLLKISDLPWEVARAAEDFGVHRLTTYAQDLARLYHAFYDACRVIQPEQRELSAARLALCEGCKNALAGALQLLGISAPNRM